MKLQGKYIGIAIAVILVILLALGLRPQAQLVETATATSSDMLVSIEEEGITRVKDRFIISSPVSGYIRRLELKVGDFVERQTLLTELEPLRSNVLDARSRAEAQARVAAAKSALSSAEEQAAAAQADADLAAGEYNRKYKLGQSNMISDEEVSAALATDQRARALLRSAKFAVEVARYDLDAASTQLKYSAAQANSEVLNELVPISAPVAGSVLKIHRESEGVVNAGEPLVELGDAGALEIAVDVLSFDAVNIKPGTRVALSGWGGKPLMGSVRLVEPVGFTKVSALGVEEQRVWVIVDITSQHEDWKLLGDGYHVDASFILWQEDNVLQIPNASLFKQDGSWATFIHDDGEASLRKVKIGKRNGLYSQVLEGIKAGEEVILHPDNAVDDGVRVKVRSL